MGLTDYEPKQLAVMGGLLVISLSITVGFLFGPAASYAGLISGPNQGNNGDQEFNAELPDQNYVEGSFNLTQRDQRVLAAENDVVFVNAFYTTEEEFNQVTQIEGVEENFNGRLYVQVANYSDSLMFQQYGLTEMPQAIVVGGTQSGIVMVEEVNQDRVASAGCNVVREWGSLAAYCQGR